MTPTLFFLVATLILAHGTGADHVVDLNAENFKQVTEENDLVLVKFFAPWCGHCKRMAPDYEKASETLHGVATLARVDCTIHDELCGEHDVRGFPTLKLFNKGVATEYSGGRNAGDIIRFLKRFASPAVQAIDSAGSLEEFKHGNEVAVVGFFDSATHEGAVRLAAVAQTLRNDYAFALAPASLGTPNSITLYRSADAESATFAKEFTEQELVSFIQTESWPLIDEIGPDNYQKYAERGLPLLWLFLDYEAPQPILTEALPTAREYKGEISVVKLDGKKWASHAKNLGINTVPGVVLAENKVNKKWVYPEGQEVTREKLSVFMRDWKAGTLKPTLRSEEPPADNNGPVKVVVGKTFEEIVNDPTKNVLVEFYAPWCGHCKTLAPEYEKLGEEFQANPSVVIAKVDATANDTPEEIQGFPTIIFYPATSPKTGITYQGERTQAGLSEFVREKAGL